MCIRDRALHLLMVNAASSASQAEEAAAAIQSLSLIHISEPTRLGMISYAVFCLKKKRRPPKATQSRSSAASDVYKRQGPAPPHGQCRQLCVPSRRGRRRNPESVSYTHLRAHETRHDLVCRLLLEKKTATTESYTE